MTLIPSAVKEAESYYGGGGDSDESDGESNRRRIAQETKSLIMKEFANRKKHSDDKKANNDAESAKYSRCKAAESTGTKVNGLTVAGREGYLTLLTDALSSNYYSTKDADNFDRKFSRHELEQCAVELEYEAFSSSTVISLYRRATAKLISGIKACKDHIYPQLKTFEPKKSNTLNQFVKDYKHQQKEKSQNFNNFVTASQLEDIEGKSEERQLSKADKDTKRKANSFKRDPLTQTTLGNFFNKASNASRAGTPDESDNDTLVIDECSKTNNNDTTLKIKEINDEQDNNPGINETSNFNTFVINITLKGIPPKEKEDDKIIQTEHDVYKSNSETRKHKHKTETDAKSFGKDKKPTSKRIIHDLFGESSESESESRESKKMKMSKSHKRDNKKNKRKKSHDKETGKSKKRDPPPVINSTALFGNMSDSESEKELIIDDDGCDIDVSKSADETLIISNITPQKTTQHNKSNDSAEHSTSLDSKSSSFEQLQAPAEEANLSKARKLSLEADEIMQKLKNFTAAPFKPEFIDMDVEITPPDFIPDSPSPSKLRDKVQLHISDISKHKKLSLSKRVEGENDTKKKVKEETSTSKNVKEVASSKNLKAVALTKDLKEVASSKNSKDESGLSQKPKEDRKAKDSKSNHGSNKESKHRGKVNEIKKEDVKKKSEKVDLAGMVVKLLMPYYKKKKISSRDLFKTTARHIVHQLLAIQVTEEAAINLLLRETFGKELKIENESDLQTKLNLSNVV